MRAGNAPSAKRGAAVTGAAPSRAEIRLRVLNALPQRHKDFFFEAVRAACIRYIGTLGARVNDRNSDALELFSEAMAKLLGASVRSEHGSDVAPAEDAAADPLPSPADWMIDPEDPKRDGRVTWLIAEVGGARALAHRFEDMRRQRWGRWQDSGYRTVQISALQSETASETIDEGQILSRVADASVQMQADPDVPRDMDDMRMAWLGLLVLAEKQFKPGDDVGLLLELLARDPDIQAGFGAEWPVGQIVQALNSQHPARPWTDDRVDNAKRRLRNWIARLRQQQGLDRTDLLALLVRCARQAQQRDSRNAAVAHAGGGEVRHG